MFISMLKELFEGNRNLFEGLAVYSDWDWSTAYPVIRLDFNGGVYTKPGNVEEHAIALVEEAEKKYEVFPAGTSRPASERLSNLIIELQKATGQRVAILVDEYDKPILDALHKPKIAKKNRDYLRGLYSVVKWREDEIKFSFFTGVSRFSKVSLFSGINNLKDITINPAYSSICGYTESDLDTVFSSELDGLDREKIRDWYNGYCWLGEDKVYNPHDILYLLETREFMPWWFRTGSTKYLIDTMKKHEVMSLNLDRIQAHSDLLESFNIDNVAPETLLFQAGYLTIVERIYDEEGGDAYYKLDYPTREVRQNLNRLLFKSILGRMSEEFMKKRKSLRRLLQDCDVKGMKEMFQSLLAGIPYQWHSRGKIVKYEAYVASVFYSYFTGTGLRVQAEDFTNRGRIDLVVTGPAYVYLFEFKVVNGKPSGTALRQILDKGYAQMYRGSGMPVYLVGVEFSSEERNIVGFEVVEDPGASS